MCAQSSVSAAAYSVEQEHALADYIDFSTAEFRFITRPNEAVREAISAPLRRAISYALTPECSCPPWVECECGDAIDRERWMARAHKLGCADDDAVMTIVMLMSRSAIWPTVDTLVYGQDGVARLP